ncbi:3-phosphoshikimate 1-carboxyvinyltransferase [Arthrobacter sp. IK3]|uniref:3-phosphoshikimate 1-carboxyvinyltransferase n=1 Tax=Arthrobacter sp. IK3 TaxID=3448169 RepID=UPI003EDFC73A
MYLSVLGTQQRIHGHAQVPNSKYHAHRALILASLAPGISRITGLTDARHVHYTVAMLRQLGTRIDIDGGTYVVHGGPYRPVRNEVSAGSSGTTLYFMVGLAALGTRDVTVTGQKYFQRRPIGPLLSALSQMGLDVGSPTGCPPIRVRAGRPAGGEVHIAGTLSQWISGLLLLAPFAEHPTSVVVDGPLNERTYLELTVRMMRSFGLQVNVREDWHRFEIPPAQEAVPADLRMPEDIGSAAFGLAAAALHPSDLLLRGLRSVTARGADHPEAHFLDVAAEMGLPMEYDAGLDGVRIRHDGLRLRPADVDCRLVPDMLPVLSAMAACADGESIFRNVGHVRLKESDRVAAMAQLNSMGAGIRATGNDLAVRGTATLTAADLSSFNDHRVLMSLAVAASGAVGRSTLSYPNAYRISYPEFLDAMNSFGLAMHVQDGPVPRRSTSRRPRSRPDQSTAPTPEAASQIPGADWVRRWARERPDQPAVVDGRPQDSGHLTWAQLDAGADKAAALLLDLGVRPGERVAFQLPNWTEFVLLCTAVLRIGAVAAPIMPIFREREVAFALHRSSAAVVVVPEQFRDRRYAQEMAGILSAGTGMNPGYDLSVRHVLVVGGAAPALQGNSSVTWHGWEQELSETTVDRERIDAAAPAADAAAQLLFTSGTTGEPKAVLHRHCTLSRAAALQARHLGLHAGDVVFIPSPLAHQTGFLYGMWLSFVLGVPQILQPVWDPFRALNLLQGWKGTFVQAATPFLADLVKAVEAGAPAPAGLRIFVNTGAGVPRHLAEQATRVLGAWVCGAFGTTETCLGAVSSPGGDTALVWGTDGQLLPGVKGRIVSDRGQPLPSGTEGNFEMLSPTMFEGYLDRPDLTKEAFTEDGWYRTGDLATLDDSGYLRITGRVRDVINRGGEKIPVAEIEQLLFRHPAVDDVALAAMPDPRLGERACAFVVPAPGVRPTLAEIIRYLDSCQVSKHYWPEQLELLDAIPRNPVGKVQKYILRDRARQLAAGAADGTDRS